MDEIVAQVKRVSLLIGQIAGATQEQSSGIGQVNESVTQLDQMTAAKRRPRRRERRRRESLKDQARKLAQAVSAFKLE